MGRRELMVWLGMPHVDWGTLFHLVDDRDWGAWLGRFLFSGLAFSAVFNKGWEGYLFVCLFGFIMFFCCFGMLLAIRKAGGALPGLTVIPNPVATIFLWWFCVWTKGGTDLLILCWRRAEDSGTRLPEPTDRLLSYG